MPAPKNSIPTSSLNSTEAHALGMYLGSRVKTATYDIANDRYDITTEDGKCSSVNAESINGLTQTFLSSYQNATAVLNRQVQTYVPPSYSANAALREAYDVYKTTNRSGSIEYEHHRMSMIAMRLRLRDGDKLPFQHLSSALVGDKVFVFVVQNGEAVILEDTKALFPSDHLTTQLGLLA